MVQGMTLQSRSGKDARSGTGRRELVQQRPVSAQPAAAPRDSLWASLSCGLVSLEGEPDVVARARAALGLLCVDRVQSIADEATGSRPVIDAVSLLDDEADRYSALRWPNRLTDCELDWIDSNLPREILFRPQLSVSVRIILRKCGIDVVGQLCLDPLRADKVAAEHGCHPDVADFLGTCGCGIVRHQARRQVSMTVAQVACLYPDACVVLLTHSRKEAYRAAMEIRADLSQLGSRERVDYIDSRRSPNSRCRIHVCRVGNGGNLSQEDIDFLFLSDARLMLKVWESGLVIAGYTLTRMFGFLQHNTHLAPSEELELSRFFGFEKLSLLPRGLAYRAR